MGPPLVSVIIPTYNRSELVSRAIESALAQTYENVEIIVVDDASTDDTRDVVRSYGDRVTLLTHETNRHVSAARNTGIERSSGEYVAFLDDDDEWLPTKLQRQYDCITTAGDEVGLVYSWMDYHDGERICKRYRPRLQGDILEQAIGGQPIGSCSTLFLDRRVLEQVGGFDESLPRGNDGDFIRRVSREYEVDYVPEVLVRHYVGHDHDRITDETPDTVRNAIKANKSKLAKFADELEADPSLKGEVYARLGLRYCQLGSFKTGLSYHLRAVRHDPFNWSVYEQQLVTMHRLLTQGVVE